MNIERMSARALLERAEVQARERMRNGQPVQLSPAPIVNAAKSEATVYIYDAIGSWYGIDPRSWVPDFNSLLVRTIHLRINSPGGSVFDAEAMRTAIAQHPAKVIVHIDGLAASAATTLAIAGNEIEMSDAAGFMIHDAWGIAAGKAEDMEAYAVMLRKATSNIVSAYVRRTGRDEKQIRGWMSAETWFTAAEAKQAGFIDRIFEDKPASTSSGANSQSARDRRARALALAALGG